jgi:hypothetical protein
MHGEKGGGVNLNLFPSGHAADVADVEIRRMDRFSPLDPSDPCRGKHGGNPESEAANVRAHGGKEEMRRRILCLFLTGCDWTSKEIAARLGKPLHAISGRLSELRAAEDLVPTGERRDGAAVLRVKG